MTGWSGKARNAKRWRGRKWKRCKVCNRSERESILVCNYRGQQDVCLHCVLHSAKEETGIVPSPSPQQMLFDETDAS